MAESGTLVIVSSDFCHWGSDFDYMPYENLRENQSQSDDSFLVSMAARELYQRELFESDVDPDNEWTPVWEFIQALDMAGIELIERQDR